MQVGVDPLYVVTQSVDYFIVVDTADGRECRRFYHCQCWLGTRGATQVGVKDGIQLHRAQSPILHSIGGNEGIDICTLFDVS